MPNSINYSRIVRFADTDAAGVVYFANVLNFCHEAYEDALLNLGVRLPQIPDFPNLALPIVQAEIEFKLPLACGDQITVLLKPRLLDRASYEIEYQIYRSGEVKLVAQAWTRHVCIDRTTRQRAELPPWLRAWILHDSPE